MLTGEANTRYPVLSLCVCFKSEENTETKKSQSTIERVSNEKNVIE